jgi:alkylation response protein AidB-like acyl-CoA dehydrogenase
MSTDPVASARELQPRVRAAADQAERERRLPAEIAEAMAKAGLYRIAAPHSFGGSEHDPVTQIRTIEAISEADGSAGWNLMIGIENFGLLSLGFPRGRELFADPLTVLAGSTAAFGRAESVEGGYRVTGAWQFVSGCHNCHYFGGLSFSCENGEPVEGAPPLFMVMPRSDIEIIDSWNVGGLRGSGSHDVRVENVFVPEENAARFMSIGQEIPVDAPIARFPRGSRLAYNKVGVALGIARAAIDDFVEIATGKVPRFSSSKLRERPLAQRAVAEAEARLRGSRAFVFEAVEDVWQTILAERVPTLEQRALLQIACSDAARACAEAVDRVAEAAGTTANFLDSPLERRARDVRVIRQHVTVAPHHLEDAGRVLLGLPPEGMMISMV